ncbi:Arabinose-binding domain of AraC transcription regulator, N-term [Bosea thiooxidans]|uniref:Arabinose-binding domain of AraC transcription regulator, N-term n=1 Tax=Bosea thiooxidans TaxID=53254 RepID=A0A1T5ABD5_9HYPH|nr:AraC family transcriptional regulator [Bosea thiooxidans]SKB32274.1 Arabinose-binding domain of AraC transcription regulator, N-term [Bosea thiooxidans]
MADIPLTRGQFLLPFVSILEDVGAPTETLLERSRLPTSLAEKSDLYLPLLPALRFVDNAQRTQGIEDFGFLAAQRLHFSHLRQKTRALIAHSPTLLVALRHACYWASREDTILSMWIEHDVDHVRVCSRLAGTRGLLHLKYAQWIQNIFSIYIVRQFAGPEWMPTAIAFESSYTPTPATRSSWPNVQFLSGQNAASISLPITLLGLPNRSTASVLPPQDHDGNAFAYDIVGLLKMMLPAYLEQRTTALADVAEIAGVTARTLQRRLARAGLTYSDVLDTVRYEHASRLLRDTDSRIIDVAFSSGYTDPAHFSRAFRRMTGITPRRFREQSQLG